MRRLAIFVLALAFGAPACDDDNPVGPSNSGPIVFTAELRASNEVPAISNAESQASGRVTITFNVPRDASGNITGDGTWNVQAVLTGFTSDSFIRSAHIHNAPAGVNGMVFIDTFTTPANGFTVPTSATINIESIPAARHPRAGRPRQPGRPLLQHALESEWWRRRPRPVDSGSVEVQGSRLQGSRLRQDLQQVIEGFA